MTFNAEPAKEQGETSYTHPMTSHRESVAVFTFSEIEAWPVSEVNATLGHSTVTEDKSVPKVQARKVNATGPIGCHYKRAQGIC